MISLPKEDLEKIEEQIAEMLAAHYNPKSRATKVAALIMERLNFEKLLEERAAADGDVDFVIDWSNVWGTTQPYTLPFDQVYRPDYSYPGVIAYDFENKPIKSDTITVTFGDASYITLSEADHWHERTVPSNLDDKLVEYPNDTTWDRKFAIMYKESGQMTFKKLEGEFTAHIEVDEDTYEKHAGSEDLTKRFYHNKPNP